MVLSNITVSDNSNNTGPRFTRSRVRTERQRLSKVRAIVALHSVESAMVIVITI